MLADEEVKHFHFIETLRRQQREATLATSRILTNVKNSFREMKEEKVDSHIDTTADSNAFRKARDIEKQSIAFYREKAAQTDN